MTHYLFKTTSFTLHFYRACSCSWHLFLLLFYGGLICKYVRNDFNVLRFAEVCFVAYGVIGFLAASMFCWKEYMPLPLCRTFYLYEPLYLQHNIDNKFFWSSFSSEHLSRCESGVLKFPTIIVSGSIWPFIHFNACLYKVNDSDIRNIHVYKYYNIFIHHSLNYDAVALFISSH